MVRARYRVQYLLVSVSLSFRAFSYAERHFSMNSSMAFSPLRVRVRVRVRVRLLDELVYGLLAFE